jgi:phenylacetate-CoA ligase
MQRDVSENASKVMIVDIGKSLQHHIKTNIGVSTKISIMEFVTLQRTQTGKAVRIVDNRPKQL